MTRGKKSMYMSTYVDHGSRMPDSAHVVRVEYDEHDER